MNRKLLSFALIIPLLSLSGCWWWGKSSEAEVKPDQKLYVINVLDKPFFDDCHIKGSIHVPFEKMNDFASKLNKNTELVIYCSNYMCSASGQVTEELIAKGFQHVWAYEAGMSDWSQRGFPCEGACKKPYLTTENKAHDGVGKVPTISSEELKQKMEKAGLL